MENRYGENDFRYMLNNEDRGLVRGLVEHDVGWSLGGPFLISKTKPVALSDGKPRPLVLGSHFYKQWFELRDTGATGWAVIFEGRSYVMLCGWVRPPQEADLDRWISFLNREIAKRHEEAGHFEAQDALITKLESLAKADAPIDSRRSVRVKPGTPIQIAFIELGHDDDPTARSLFDARGKRRDDHKAEVVRYLRSGRRTAFCMGVDADVFDETKLADSPHAMTDGVFAWPQVLAYYVEHYDVELPDAFEEHMRKNGWKVPSNAADLVNLFKTA